MSVVLGGCTGRAGVPVTVYSQALSDGPEPSGSGLSEAPGVAAADPLGAGEPPPATGSAGTVPQAARSSRGRAASVVTTCGRGRARVGSTAPGCHARLSGAP